MDIVRFFIEMPERTKTIVGLLFIVITSVLVAFTKSKLFQTMLVSLFNWFSSKGNENDSDQQPDQSTYPPIDVGYSIKETDIINHDLFNYVDFWLYNQIPSITLRTQYRTAVFKKYLHIYYKTYRDLIKDYIKDDRYKSMDDAELRNSLLFLLSKITRTMEMEMREIGIPDVIIIKMKNALNDRINLTIDLINSICDSSFYNSENNYLKIYSSLNIIHSILDNTMANVTTVCNVLNGELVGLTMDGFVEPRGHSNK